MITLTKFSDLSLSDEKYIPKLMLMILKVNKTNTITALNVSLIYYCNNHRK